LALALALYWLALKTSGFGLGLVLPGLGLGLDTVGLVNITAKETKARLGQNLTRHISLLKQGQRGDAENKNASDL